LYAEPRFLHLLAIDKAQSSLALDKSEEHLFSSRTKVPAPPFENRFYET